MININPQHGHPLCKSIRSLAQQVESFKSPQTIFGNDSHDNSPVTFWGATSGKKSCDYPNLLSSGVRRT